jgi:hypothetical protein
MEGFPLLLWPPSHSMESPEVANGGGNAQRLPRGPSVDVECVTYTDCRLRKKTQNTFNPFLPLSLSRPDSQHYMDVS